jgi:hypothetical protein
LSRDSDVFEPYPEPEAIWGYLEERFGMDPAAFAGYGLWHRPGTKAIWILAGDVEPPADLAVEWAGLAVMRQAPPRGFPTSAFLRRFGHLATKNVYEVDWDTALRLMYNHQLEYPALDERGGPYVVRSPRGTVGRGWVRKGRLALETPKAWVNQLMPRTELAEVAEPPA